MSIVHSKSTSVLSQSSSSITGGTSINGSGTDVGNTEIVIDQTFPAGSSLSPLPVAFTLSSLQSFILLSDQNLTITTNGVAANEVQSLSVSGSPTAGTFTLTFGGQTTAAIAYNATAATIQSALSALSSIGSGNVQCAGGPLPSSAVTVTFTGNLGDSAQALLSVNNSGMTGGSIVASQTTQGASAGNTFNLVAGTPFDWSLSAGYYPCPFTQSVTQFLISCSAASRLRCRILVS